MLDYKELIKNFKEEDFKLKRVNLHVHTDYSDGEGDFDELVEQAEAKNYNYIAITDHNTMKGYSERNSAVSPVLIPGVEFEYGAGMCSCIFWLMELIRKIRNLKNFSLKIRLKQNGILSGLSQKEI